MKRNYYFISFSFFFLLIEEKRYFHVGFSQPKKFYLYKKYTHLYLGLMKKKNLLLIENHMLIWFWFLIFISWGMLCTPIYSKLGGQTTFFLPLSLSLYVNLILRWISIELSKGKQTQNERIELMVLVSKAYPELGWNRLIFYLQLSCPRQEYPLSFNRTRTSRINMIGLIFFVLL